MAEEPRDDSTQAWRWPRVAAFTTVAVGVVVLTTTAAGAWYYADELLLVRPGPVEYPVDVVSVDASRVTLRGEGAGQPGITGLEWDGGYARLGDDVENVRDEGGDTVVRSFTPYPDTPVAGAAARVDFYASPLDLASVSDLDVRNVVFGGPLGPYPATFVPGEDARWVIHVHGRGGNRAEGYRLMPSVHALGHPQLAISYRNDDDAPADPDGEFGLGWTESADLAAAIEFARAEGARDFVLVGYSMGGAVVGNYLRTTDHADVAGVVYDSPVLSWPDVLAAQATDRNLPEFTGTVASAAVRLRTGIRLGLMDQVAAADDLDVPVLLIHGSGDETVPVTSSDAFAEARPDLVTYVRPDGVGHVQSWNNDPAGYEKAVAAFVTGLD